MRRLSAFLLVGILITSGLAFVAFEDRAGGGLPAPDVPAYAAHAPIRIDSNVDFAIGINGVSAGDGSAGNPWLISGWEIIGAGSGDCIYIGNTTDFFTVNGCNLRWAAPPANWYWQYWTMSGLQLQNVTNGFAFDNVCTNNEGSGIYMWNCADIALHNNTMMLNGYDNLYINQCLRVTMTDNKMTGGGIDLQGWPEQYWSTHIVDATNTVNGKPIRYWVGATGGTVPAGAGQIILAGCIFVNVTGQTISTPGWGIMLGFSMLNNIRNNTISGGSAIYLFYSKMNDIRYNSLPAGRIYFGVSDSNLVSDNTITGGIAYGIMLSDSNNNLLARNTVSDISGSGNWDSAISLYSADDTIIEDNIIQHNNHTGLNINQCQRITLTGNAFVEDGIILAGDNIVELNTHDIDGTNTVNGRSVRYVYDLTGWSAAAGSGQIIAVNCTNVAITNQNVSNGSVGVQLMMCRNVTVSDVVSSGQQYGIYATYCRNITVDNGIYDFNNADGIFLTRSEDVAVSGARCSYNYWYGASFLDCENATISNVNASYNVYDGICVTSNDCTIRDCTAVGNDHGFYLTVGNSSIYNNTANDNGCGIMIYDGANNTLTSNTCMRNTMGFYFVYNCDNNTITDNLFFNNMQAIQLQGVLYGNRIYHNEFILNYLPVVDDGINRWDNGYPSGGNYWSDYNGTDVKSGPGQNIVGSDGLGDVPYWNIWDHPWAMASFGNITDDYPIMTPSVDLEPPESYAMAEGAYWHNSPTTIAANCTDEHNTVDEVSLWYIFSPTNGSWPADEIPPNNIWSNCTFFDTDNSAPWCWTFDFPDGEGNYLFYSLSVDSEGNNETLTKEPWPGPAEVLLGYDHTPPLINLTSHANNSYVTPGEYICYNIIDNGSCTASTNWTMNDGEATGTYASIDTSYWSDRHYFINVTALDKAGNVEFASYEFDVDTTRPTVVSTTPADDATEVALDSTVIIEFSEPMNTTSVEELVAFSPMIAVASYDWDSDLDTVTIVPAGSLTINTTYDCSVFSGAMDMAGNILNMEYSWTFSTPLDTDGDGILDVDDPDDDNDGVPDAEDAFPLDSTEWLDTDGDGTGDNADTDDDDDGVLDADDAFPLDPDEWLDTDGDGIGNNADPDDDNDGVPDADDFDPLDPDVTEDPDAQTAIGSYWWILVILVVAIIAGAAVFFMRKRKPPVPGDGERPPPPPPDEGATGSETVEEPEEMPAEKE